MAALDRSEKALQRRYEENNRLERQSLEQQAEAAPPKATGTEPIAAPVPTHAGQPLRRSGQVWPRAHPKGDRRSRPPNRRRNPRQSPRPSRPPEDPFRRSRSLTPSRQSRQQNRPRGLARLLPLTRNTVLAVRLAALGRALGGDENKAAPAATEKPERETRCRTTRQGDQAGGESRKARARRGTGSQAGAKPDKPLPDDPFADEPAAGEKSAKKSADKEPAGQEVGRQGTRQARSRPTRAIPSRNDSLRRYAAGVATVCLRQRPMVCKAR